MFLLVRLHVCMVRTRGRLVPASHVQAGNRRIPTYGLGFHNGVGGQQVEEVCAVLAQRTPSEGQFGETLSGMATSFLQYLPVAQRLIDQLRDPSSEINLATGAPDPTAGEHDDVAIWCLDETSLHENIKKILISFVKPSPTVWYGTR